MKTMQKEYPRRRPLPTKPKLSCTAPSDDEVFVRLIKDLQLVKRTEKRVAKGELPEDKLELAKDFERRVFEHLYAYLDAKAWTRKNLAGA